MKSEWHFIKTHDGHQAYMRGVAVKGCIDIATGRVDRRSDGSWLWRTFCPSFAGGEPNRDLAINATDEEIRGQARIRALMTAQK